MKNNKTEQELFWKGEFGEDYIKRNNSDDLLKSKINLWSRMIKSIPDIYSALELGCNIGLNLKALNSLNSNIELKGIEINEKAANEAKKLKIAKINQGTIIDSIDGEKFDLTFTVGVLIHINPGFLTNVYDNLYNNSNKYILINEYFNPTPVSIPYRGHENKLFKRDFAGELIDSYNLKLVDYGFAYSRDDLYPQDDMTWFLLEKT